jgi:hypothetical protein
MTWGWCSCRYLTLRICAEAMHSSLSRLCLLQPCFDEAQQQPCCARAGRLHLGAHSHNHCHWLGSQPAQVARAPFHAGEDIEYGSTASSSETRDLTPLSSVDSAPGSGGGSGGGATQQAVFDASSPTRGRRRVSASATHGRYAAHAWLYHCNSAHCMLMMRRLPMQMGDKRLINL